MRIQDSIAIEAPVEVVWRLTEDVERWPDMTPTITSVERLEPGPLGVGSTARIKQPGQRPTVWTVTEHEPCRRFVWGARSLGLRMTALHTLAETPGGCTNTLAVELGGPLAVLFGWLGRRRLAKVLATENAGFKREAEAAVRAESR